MIAARVAARDRVARDPQHRVARLGRPAGGGHRERRLLGATRRRPRRDGLPAAAVCSRSIACASAAWSAPSTSRRLVALDGRGASPTRITCAPPASFARRSGSAARAPARSRPAARRRRRTAAARAAAAPSAARRRPRRASRSSSTSATARGRVSRSREGIDRQRHAGRVGDGSAPPTRVVLLRREGREAEVGRGLRSSPPRRPRTAPSRPWPRRRPLAGAAVAAAATAPRRATSSTQQRRRQDRGARTATLAPRETSQADRRNATGSRKLVETGQMTRSRRRDLVQCPRQAEPPEGVRGTGEPISWGEPRPERRGAQALSAPARQLTPQADERGLCRCSRGRSPHSSLRCCASSSRPRRGRLPPPDGRHGLRGGAAAAADAAPGRWTGVEVPGTVAQLLPDGTAAAPADAPDQVKQAIWAANSLQDLPYRYGGGHNLEFDAPRARLLRHRLVRAARRRACSRRRWTPARFMRWGVQGQGRLDHRLHEPGPRLRGDRRPAARHERRRHEPRARESSRTAFESGPRWRPMGRAPPRGFVKRHPVSLLDAEPTGDGAAAVGRAGAGPYAWGTGPPTRR